MATRNFLISLFVAVCILFVGGFLFRGSEAGTQLAVVASFAIGLTLLNVFDSRERRAKQSHD